MQNPLPAAFISRIEKERDDAGLFLAALNQPPITSVRLHPLKGKSCFTEHESVPWYGFGKYLPDRPLFTIDPHFHAGAYYPQEAGSMAIAAVVQQLNLPENCLILDLCAAPGGKTTLLHDVVPQTSLIVANEPNAQRNKALVENTIRWGTPNVIVTQASSNQLLQSGIKFDLILIDAPCSGEGMFRKDPEARKAWHPKLGEKCSAVQRNILTEAVKMLSKNGYLIYSTCTYNQIENEKHNYNSELINLSKITVDFNFDTIGFEKTENNAFRTHPHYTKAEGFYFSLYQNNSSSVNESPITATPYNPSLLTTSDLKVIAQHLDWPQEGFFRFSNTLHWLSPDFHNIYQILNKSNIIMPKKGLNIGKIWQQGLIPHHELAMMHKAMRFPSIAVDRQQAIHFLKGQILSNENTLPTLIRYQNNNIGWQYNHQGTENGIPISFRIKNQKL